ncbi:MAG: apolipoprotein N-acyltransferase, partial [Frankiales bacterium]|nr:apolipoprotein N-acyltransferase [Frankiales bacterium]
DDTIVRQAVQAGGRLLVVQTNNATYGRTPQPRQQLAMTRLRAVEHGRAVVVAATSGISAVISPDGTVLDRTQVFTQKVLTADVPQRTQRTVATRVGVWPEVVLGLFAVAAVGRALSGGSARRRTA